MRRTATRIRLLDGRAFTAVRLSVVRCWGSLAGPPPRPPPRAGGPPPRAMNYPGAQAAHDTHTLVNVRSRAQWVPCTGWLGT